MLSALCILQPSSEPGHLGLQERDGPPDVGAHHLTLCQLSISLGNAVAQGAGQVNSGCRQHDEGPGVLVLHHRQQYADLVLRCEIYLISRGRG